MKISEEIKKFMHIPGNETYVMEKLPDGEIRQYSVTCGINGIRYCIRDLSHRDSEGMNTYSIWMVCNGIRSIDLFEIGMFYKKTVKDVLSHEGDDDGFLDPDELLEMLED